MFRLTRLPAVGLLILTAGLTATPVRSDPPKLTPAEKKQQITAIEKELAALKARLDALKAAPAAPAAVPPTLPPDAMGQMPWRCIGPANMGGRVTALAVNDADPTTFFVATASGGLLKTVNNGTTFSHLFDDQATVSLGDVAIAPSDPNVVWVGTGEANPRNSVSYGDGVYKSTDGGKTFTNVGLKAGFQTGRVLIHPTDPNTVYVGVLGRLYGPNPDRGLFKTTDGGTTWAKVLFVDDTTGVIDARLDPFDPDTLLVATYERKRDEYDGFQKSPPPVPDAYGPIVTHAAGSAVWKSTDAGKSWLKLSDANRPTGLPTVKLGRIGLDFSRKQKGLVYAIVDTEKVGTGTIPDTYLGVVGEDVKGGGVKLDKVTADGPADNGGLKVGDVIVSSDGKKTTTYQEFVDKFLEKKPGDTLKLVVKRGDTELTLGVKLGQRKGGERPPPIVPKVIAGFAPGRPAAEDPDGIPVGRVTDGGPADKAGIKPGDRIVKIDGKDTPDLRAYQEAVADREPESTAKFTIARGDATEVVEVAFAPNPQTGPAGSTEERRPYGLGLGGQQPNAQNRQGENAFQTGGVFVSTDGGSTWKRVNSLNPRPMYFSKIRTDPTDAARVYVIGDSPAVWASTDGGATFQPFPTKGVHPDAHAFWIDPADGRHMILGCDGGFYLTYDRGDHWDHLNTLALGQFYHVAVDGRRPYRAYGGLQDNGTWGGPSRTQRTYGPVNEDYVFLAGGDGFVVRIDPTDPDQIYFESQNGHVGRRNLRTGERAVIRPKTEKGAPELRFNWNTPFVLSHHNPGILYVGAQHVWRSVARGDDLKRVSPELTRTDQGTLSAISESPKSAETVWAGTDDGFVWVTKDGGANWSNVTENLTAAGLPGRYWVASLEASRAKDGRCYAALDAHRSDDDKPYLFVTEDFGATWKPLAGTLPQFGSTRVLREDRENPDLLYAGTEFGAWASADRGGTWAELGAGLPTVAVHEFAQATTAPEVVAATHGRSLWVIDVASLRQMTAKAAKDPVTLFTPEPVVRWRSVPSASSPFSAAARAFVGDNPPAGVSLDYRLTVPAESVSLRLFDVTGKVVREFKNPPKEVAFHRVRWDLSAPRPGRGGGTAAVPPAVYRVVLAVDGKEYARPVTVEPDPNAAKDAVTADEDDDLFVNPEKRLKQKLREPIDY